MIPLVFCLSLLLHLPRVDSVTVEGLLLPDPGKGQQMLVGFGRYSLAEGRKVTSIKLCAQEGANPQWVSAYADCNAKGEWNAKIPLQAGDYSCWVELITTDAPGDPKLARTGVLTHTKRELVRVK